MKPALNVARGRLMLSTVALAALSGWEPLSRSLEIAPEPAHAIAQALRERRRLV